MTEIQTDRRRHVGGRKISPRVEAAMLQKPRGVILTRLNQFIIGDYDSLVTLDQLCQFLTAAQEMRALECRR